MDEKPEAVGSGYAGATKPPEGVVRGGGSQETMDRMSVQEDRVSNFVESHKTVKLRPDRAPGFGFDGA